MFKKAKLARDAFTFSLGGVTAIAPFANTSVIADDRINKILENRRRQNQEDQPATAQEIVAIRGRFWVLGRRRRRRAT